MSEVLAGRMSVPVSNAVARQARNALLARHLELSYRYGEPLGLMPEG